MAKPSCAALHHVDPKIRRVALAATLYAATSSPQIARGY